MIYGNTVMQVGINSRRRRGGVLVEAAITTSVFLTLVVGMIDLGIYVFRTHVITQAARQGARTAIVHGSLAPSGWNGGPWGPTTYDSGSFTVSSPPSAPQV